MKGAGREEGEGGFTPGPWEFCWNRFNGATVPGSLGSIRGSGWWIAALEDAPEQVANAALIAAAPDLLAALEACEETLRLIHEAAGPLARTAPMPKHSTFEAWRLAEAAIAKARGQTNAAPSTEQPT